MSTLESTRLVELIVDALERTAFVLADPWEDDSPPEDFAPSRFARIAFSGHLDGVAILEADEGFVRELASSMLGCEPDEVDADVQGRDALTEMANIVGGSIALALGADEHDYTHGLPETIETDAVPATTPEEVHGWIQSEDGMLRVRWLDHHALKAAA